MKNLLKTVAKLAFQGMPALRQLFGDSSLSVGLMPDLSAAPIATFFGWRDVQSPTSGASCAAESWSGDAFIGRISMDTRIGKPVLTGISALLSESNLEYGKGTAVFKTISQGCFPDFGLEYVGGSLFLHLAGILGQGEVRIGSNATGAVALQSSYFKLGANGPMNLHFCECTPGIGPTISA